MNGGGAVTGHSRTRGAPAEGLKGAKGRRTPDRNAYSWRLVQVRVRAARMVCKRCAPRPRIAPLFDDYCLWPGWQWSTMTCMRVLRTWLRARGASCCTGRSTHIPDGARADAARVHFGNKHKLPIAIKKYSF